MRRRMLACALGLLASGLVSWPGSSAFAAPAKRKPSAARTAVTETAPSRVSAAGASVAATGAAAACGLSGISWREL